MKKCRHIPTLPIRLCIFLNILYVIRTLIRFTLSNNDKYKMEFQIQHSLC